MPKIYSRGMWQKLFLAGESMHFFVFVFIFFHLLNICFRAESTHTLKKKKSVSNLITLLLPFAYTVFNPLYSYSMLLIKVFKLGNKLLILMSLRANKIMESSAFKKNFHLLPLHPHIHNLVNSLLHVSDKKLKGGGDST